MALEQPVVCLEPPRDTPVAGTASTRLRLSSRLFDYFVVLKQRHGIDMEDYQILSAFTLTGLSEMSRRTGAGAVFQPERFEATLGATALSRMLGLPRETVRRKLGKLEEKALVTRRDGRLYVMQSYHRDLDIICLIERLLDERASSRGAEHGLTEQPGRA